MHSFIAIQNVLMQQTQDLASSQIPLLNGGYNLVQSGEQPTVLLHIAVHK